MIDPKDITVEDIGGNAHSFRLYRIPYMDGGREICNQFLYTAAPKVGDYAENERLSQIMFKFIAVILSDGKEQLLNTKALVNNHITDFKVGMEVEEAMISHNMGFSIAGKVRESQNLTSLTGLKDTETSTLSPDALSTTAAAPSMNSELSIP